MLVTMNPTRGMNAAIPFPPGTTTKYWAFARGGAWRNPKPTGGPYVCEQCRLDACGGNDATFTLQAVTTIELAPADVCADCGARSTLPAWQRQRPCRACCKRTTERLGKLMLVTMNPTRRDERRHPIPAGNHDQVLGVCTGRRMAQPEADRWPLRLRAMPPGRLRRKRRNLHPAGRHNNRVSPCGRVRRLRGAVVGGTFGGSIDGYSIW